jgi:hypothetical protein
MMNEKEKLPWQDGLDGSSEGFAGADKAQIGVAGTEQDAEGDGSERLSNEEVIRLKESHSDREAASDYGLISDPSIDDNPKPSTVRGSINDPL